MQIREKLAYIALGGVLVVIGHLLLQSDTSLLSLVQAEDRDSSISEPKPIWTQGLFTDWYQCFIKARDEAEGVDLSGVDFAKFQTMGEYSEIPIGIDLQWANLKGTNLKKADFRGANLTGSILAEANLQEANLLSAELRNVNLVAADLKGANLQQASLQGARLSLANLQQTNLQGTGFYFADLQQANLQEANLLGAILQEANLRGANLQKSDLRGTNLKGAVYDDATKFPKGFDPFKAGMVMTGLIDTIE